MSPARRALLGCALLALSACGGDPPKPVAPAVDAGAMVPVAPKQKSLGQLEAPQGTVTLERGGQQRPAAAEPLYPGDVIETGEDGSAQLRFSGDRVVELGADGRFELDLDGTGVMLNVARGLVLTRVKATPGNEEGDVLLTISTPFGLTRIGAAELSMKVDESSADVDVKLGEIELVSKSGEVTKVGAGKKGLLGAARELPEIALTVVTSTGRGELKAKNAKAFVAMNPKKPPALKPGDVVRVKEGKLSLAPEGSSTRLALLKGAEVGIVESRRGPGREATALDVKKGELEVSAPKGQSTRVAVAGGITLVSDLGGQYSLRRTGSGFDVDALAGDVTIEREGQAPTVVQGGQSARIPLKGGAPAVKAATREGVVLPSRAGLRVYHQSLKQVSLSWDDAGAENETWRVQVATDPSFTNLVRDGVVHDNFLTVPVPPKGAWYWKVFKGDVEHAKGAASFAPEPRSQDLSRLKNVVPEGAETTTIFFQDKDKPPVVTFSWGKDDAAAKYAVKVYREGQLGTPVAERAVSELSVSLPENTLLEGKYLWSVTPLDAKGGELKGGRMNKLHLVFDNAVAALSIKSPRNGDPGGRSVNASGVAPVGSKLFINGKSVPLDAQARFDTTVSPAAGGRIVFRLLHGGAEIYTVRTVRSR
ncbi:MAG: FecR domain-containing protein [Archangium sp.]|nr:FecR domain-containing protein [Archangium sp.]